ncbi:dCTP deaminase domain-containing protein [Phyllobacterium phragmitis]
MTDGEIRRAGLVKYASDSRYNATSYDLGIGEIIDSEGRRYSEVGYLIKPQEIVWLVSRENVVLPEDITAHANIRTSLCNSGLLALNFGIVDPGWNGPLATAIVNFSKMGYFVKIEEKFLRLSFFQHNIPSKTNPISIDRKTYINDRVAIASRDFGATFLNVDKLSEEVAERIIKKKKEDMILYGAVLSISFGLAVIFISIATYVMPIFWGHPFENGSIDSRLKTLEERVLETE